MADLHDFLRWCSRESQRLRERSPNAPNFMYAHVAFWIEKYEQKDRPTR